MGYRELGMVELREIVRRWQAGEGIRAMARGTGLDRKTIAEYLRALPAVGLQPGGAPPTDEQLTAIASARRPGRLCFANTSSDSHCDLPPAACHGGEADPGQDHRHVLSAGQVLSQGARDG